MKLIILYVISIVTIFIYLGFMQQIFYCIFITFEVMTSFLYFGGSNRRSSKNVKYFVHFFNVCLNSSYMIYFHQSNPFPLPSSFSQNFITTFPSQFDLLFFPPLTPKSIEST